MGTGVAVVLLLLGLILQGSNAAVQIDVQRRLLESLQSMESHPRQYGFLKSGNDISKLLRLTEDESLEESARAPTVTGSINVKYKQFFKGIPVFNAHVVLAKNDRNGEIERNAYGKFVQKIFDDVTSITPALSKVAALDRVLFKEGDKDTHTIITDSQVETYIYVDEDTSIAYLAYFIKYTANSHDHVKMPNHMINANDGREFFSYNGIKSYRVEGVGGNEKLGKYFFGRHPKLGKLDVVKTADGKCHLKNDDIEVFHMYNRKTRDFGAKPYAYDCNVLIQDEVNGGFSPLYDAFYFGTKVFEMFREWVGVTAVVKRPVPLLVHYRHEYGNAMWSGSGGYAAFGDGNTKFYPFSAFDVIAHELAHGFTDDNSDLVYKGMSGGINEAFSDITGEAFEWYLNFTSIDWKSSYYIRKGSASQRWFDRPSKDGRSIDRASQYDGRDIHFTSGVYNRAFYTLSNLPGWDIKMGFQVAAYANRIYWYPSVTFDEGACGMERAAEALGFNKADVRKAFDAVEVVCNGTLDAVIKTELIFGRLYTGLYAAYQEKQYYKFYLAHIDKPLLVISIFGTRNVDVYFKKGRWLTPTTYDKKIRSIESFKTILIAEPTAGFYFILLYAAPAYRNLNLATAAQNILPLYLGNPIGKLSAAVGDVKVFRLLISDDTGILSLTLSGGTGNAYMYVQRGELPSGISYDRYSRRPATIISARRGIYYIVLNGYSAFSGVTLEAEHVTVTSLSLGVPVTNLAAGSRQKMFFKLSVPSGSFVQLLAIRTSGGSGNADLFVRNSYLPTTSSYGWSSRRANNNEEITFPVFYITSYYILLYGTSPFSGVTLEVVNVTVASLTLGVPVRSLTGRSRKKMFFKLSVPSGSFVQLLAIHTFGGSGNVDLLVRDFYLPTTASYRWSSKRADNNEEITFFANYYRTLYVLLYGTSAFADVTLKATNVTISPLSIDSSLKNLAAGAGEKLFYKVTVSQGSYIHALNISLSGGYGNASLYTKMYYPATTLSYNWKSQGGDNEEYVVCSGIYSGFYHILLYGTSAFSGVTLEVVNVTVASLTLGVPATNLTGRSREEMFFKLSVPSGSFVQLLAIHAFGGSGNVDLFVRNLYLPTTSSYGLSSRREDNNEEITFPVPHYNTLYVLLYGTSAFADVTLKATNVTISPLSIGASLNNLAAGAGEKLFYKVTVSQGSYVQSLNISLSGGYGNASLYVKRNYPATVSSYNWKSRGGDDEDHVVCSRIFPGFYFILLYGTSAFSGVTLEVVNVTVSYLTLGVPVTHLTGRSREKMFFKLSVPSGSFVQLLAIHAYGGSGNVDLFVRNLYLPTTSSYGWSSRKGDNNEDITFPVPHYNILMHQYSLAPQPEGIYVLLYGTSAFADVTLKATNVAISRLSIGSSLHNLAAGAGEKLFYKVTVLQGSYIQALNISLSGGDGNADIYVKRNYPATVSSYNWKSLREYNEDYVVCSGILSGLYHILIYGSSPITNKTLRVKYTTIPILELDVPASNFTLNANGIHMFKLILLHFRIAKHVIITVSGAVSMYIRKGESPSSFRYHYNSRSVSIYGPPKGVYYVLLTAGVTQYGVSLVATSSTLDPVVLLQNAVPINLQANNKTRLYFKFVLYPHSPARSMNITLFGGHGDADLYVTKGAWPNIKIYDKISNAGGIKDAVFIQSPAAGIYYILVYAFTDFHNYTLRATNWSPPIPRPTTPGVISSTSTTKNKRQKVQCLTILLTMYSILS